MILSALMGLMLPPIAYLDDPSLTAPAAEPYQIAALSLRPFTIIGGREDAQQVTGAAYVLDEPELRKMEYADINKILRQVPGISIQQEDGFGLRPNISIRGTATERSSRITLMEDNVLIAPAPYSAPSAYYFPTAGRMQGVEVLKGPAAITQGPYTIGGALNLISTEIPETASGLVQFEAGEDATLRAHAYYGDSTDRSGWLVETHQWQSDGFQAIDFSDRDTGLSKQDYMAKLRWATPIDGQYRHQFDLKIQTADEESDQSYLGLTDADFRADPNRRYAASALDNIQTDHQLVNLTWIMETPSGASFATTAYYNDFSRNWFKSEGLDADGSDSAADFSRTSWFNVIQAVNRGQGIGDLDAAALQAILDGADTLPGSIQLRSNNREYYSQGIQTIFTHQLVWGNTPHELQAGLRYHEDQEDRLQRNSTYHLQSGSLVLDDLGQLGNAGNRVQDAEAWAAYVYDRINLGQWTLTPGLRYENIDQSRTRWEIRPGQTDDPASRDPANLRDTRENNTDVWLPGIGALYEVNDNWRLVAGVHKGFTAPTNQEGVNEEESINYEFGFRYFNGPFYADVIGFYTDYDNLLGVCTNSSGGDCEQGQAFNGDAASVRGLEVLLSHDLSSNPDYAIPLRFSYTYLDGTFDSDIADTAFFGDVQKGDPLPYLPDHQFLAQVGIEMNQWSAYLNANYVDQVCVRGGCVDQFEKTDDSLTFDLAGHYQVNDSVEFYARLLNLTDERDIVGRQPYGARPTLDRTLLVGVRVGL